MEVNEENKFEELTETLKEYINTQYELFQLNIADKGANAGGQVISIIILSLIGFLCLIFLSIAFGFYLSYLLDSNLKGFVLLGGIYFLVFVFMLLFRNKLISSPIRDKIIRNIFNN